MMFSLFSHSEKRGTHMRCKRGIGARRHGHDGGSAPGGWGRGGHGGIARESFKDGVIQLMGLKPADVVADLGSGDGFYAAGFAAICERVYAVDAYADSFANAYYENPRIIQVVQDVCEGLELPGITHVFFSNSFHDMGCQDRLLDTIAASLAPHCRVTMIEFKLDTPYGPPRIRFAEEDLVKRVEAHGFARVGSLDLGEHFAVSFERV